jgi:hypothetical protein
MNFRNCSQKDIKMLDSDKVVRLEDEMTEEENNSDSDSLRSETSIDDYERSGSEWDEEIKNEPKLLAVSKGDAISYQRFKTAGVIDTDKKASLPKN